MVKYLIFFQPRCGSTYIASRLDCHQYGCLNGFEIMSPGTIIELGLFPGANPPQKLSDFDQKIVLDLLYKKNQNFEFVGGKVAPYQLLDIPGFFQHALTSCHKFIFLYRENIYQTALSSVWTLIREQQGKNANMVKGEVNTVTNTKIDRAIFEYYVYTSALQRDLVLSLSKVCNKDKIVFSYEEFFTYKEVCFQRLCKFLGINQLLPESNIIKIRTEGTNLFINEAEVNQWINELGLTSN